MALSQSAAHVAVFSGGQQLTAYDVPRDTRGTVWTVVELEAGHLRTINSLGFASSSSDITRFSLTAPPAEDPAIFWNLPAK